MADEFRYFLSHPAVEEVYSTRTKYFLLAMTESCFDNIDWLALRHHLANKTQMYPVWIMKQNFWFCRTCVQVCGQPEERASHLNLCPDVGWTRLLQEQMVEFAKWLNDNHTHPDLAYSSCLGTFRHMVPCPSLLLLPGIQQFNNWHRAWMILDVIILWTENFQYIFEMFNNAGWLCLQLVYQSRHG